MKSFVTVEGEGFRKMISVIYPQLTVKHHTTYARQLPKLFNDMKQRLHFSFDQEKSDLRAMAKTSDLWT